MITFIITMIINNIIIVVSEYINTISITSIVVIANIIKIFKWFMNMKASRNMFYSRPFALSSILSLFITLSSILYYTIFYYLFFTFLLFSFIYFPSLHFLSLLSSFISSFNCTSFFPNIY